MGTQNIFFSHVRDKTKKHLSQFRYQAKINHLSYSIYKHNAIDIADPGSM